MQLNHFYSNLLFLVIRKLLFGPQFDSILVNASLFVET